MGSLGQAEGKSPVDVSIAITPNNVNAVPGLLQDITTGVAALSSGGDEARHDLLLKARSLVQALETPRETMIKHCWAQTGAMAGLTLGVDTGLWTLMAKNGDGPQKVSELAKALGIDPVLLGRMMRHLGAMGYLIETGADEYKPTNFIKALSIPIIGDGYPAVLAGTTAATLRFHEFARKSGWKDPTDANDTALMYAYNTDKDMFAWLQATGHGTQFNHHMGGYRQGRLPWMAPNFYPVQDRLISGADTSPDAAFIVDIGGSLGHDLMAFHKYHPSVPGKLILEDLPVVLGEIKEIDPAITTLGYDFHTEQPIKGARAYYMHSVLHDWPDDVCQSILSRIKAAMKPGYSRLLINENVIPKTGAYWESSALDMMMLTLFCSRERTEADWRRLLEDKAGLKIVKIWGEGKGVESLIEVELPQN